MSRYRVELTPVARVSGEELVEGSVDGKYIRMSKGGLVVEVEAEDESAAKLEAVKTARALGLFLLVYESYPSEPPQVRSLQEIGTTGVKYGYSDMRSGFCVAPKPLDVDQVRRAINELEKASAALGEITSLDDALRHYQDAWSCECSGSPHRYACLEYIKAVESLVGDLHSSGWEKRLGKLGIDKDHACQVVKIRNDKNVAHAMQDISGKGDKRCLKPEPTFEDVTLCRCVAEQCIRAAFAKGSVS